MLKEQQILDKLKSLNFPVDDYCVMTGAALVLYGVREETADIDIGCNARLFAELLQRGFNTEQRNEHKGIVIDKCVEIFEGWLPDRKTLIKGIPVADILEIRKYKEQLGRDKDLKDIELINRFLNKKKLIKTGLGAE